jgi:hypothetical protein
MRGIEETCHFPIQQAPSHHPSRTQGNAIGSDSCSTAEAEYLSAAGAIRSIAPKLSLQRGAKFREGMGNGLRQNEDQNHESDRKHSQ